MSEYFDLAHALKIFQDNKRIVLIRYDGETATKTAFMSYHQFLLTTEQEIIDLHKTGTYYYHSKEDKEHYKIERRLNKAVLYQIASATDEYPALDADKGGQELLKQIFALPEYYCDFENTWKTQRGTADSYHYRFILPKKYAHLSISQSVKKAIATCKRLGLSWTYVDENGKIKNKIDIKGRSCYVMSPESKHPSGDTYNEINPKTQTITLTEKFCEDFLTFHDNEQNTKRAEQHQEFLIWNASKATLKSAADTIHDRRDHFVGRGTSQHPILEEELYQSGTNNSITQFISILLNSTDLQDDDRENILERWVDKCYDNKNFTTHPEKVKSRVFNSFEALSKDCKPSFYSLEAIYNRELHPLLSQALNSILEDYKDFSDLTIIYLKALFLSYNSNLFTTFYNKCKEEGNDTKNACTRTCTCEGMEDNESGAQWPTYTFNKLAIRQATGLLSPRVSTHMHAYAEKKYKDFNFEELTLTTKQIIDLMEYIIEHEGKELTITEKKFRTLRHKFVKRHKFDAKVLELFVHTKVGTPGCPSRYAPGKDLLLRMGVENVEKVVVDDERIEFVDEKAGKHAPNEVLDISLALETPSEASDTSEVLNALEIPVRNRNNKRLVEISTGIGGIGNPTVEDERVEDTPEVKALLELYCD